MRPRHATWPGGPGRAALAVTRREEAEAKLITIWRRLLRRDDIDADSDWFELLPYHRTPLLINEIRLEFGLALPIAVVYRDSRLSDLARTVVTGAIPDRIERIVSLRTGRARPALVYVPGAFGEDLHARDDLVLLSHPVHFLRAPGLDEGERPLSKVADLADFYLDQVMEALPDEPVVLAGFSLGALVAMEMDRLGARRNWRPLYVILIDLLPPLGDEGADEFDADDLLTFRLQRIVDQLAERAGGPPPQCFGAALTEDKIEEVTTFLHSRNSPDLPPGVPFSFLERRLRVYAAGTQASSTHTVRPCECPVGLIRSAEGRELGVTWADASAAGPPEILDVDCTHSTLWRSGIGATALEHFLSGPAARRPGGEGAPPPTPG